MAFSLCENVPDVVEAGVGGDHHDGVANLNGIHAGGDQDLTAPVDGCDEDILLHPGLQILQHGAGDPGSLIDPEFHGLDPVLTDVVQGTGTSPSAVCRLKFPL